MITSYNTVFSEGSGEIIVKKSRFIANVFPVESEEAANEMIESLRKKYWDASHNCYAYIIGTNQPLMRYSDDGEPSQTAGKPMLDVLLSHELTNLLVVVTRYFGGTLLGTGGLVKAYQSALLEGLKHSKLITKEAGTVLMIHTDYTMLGKIQYLAAQENLPILSTEYTEEVNLKLLVSMDQSDFIIKKITELTNGSAILDKSGQVHFTMIDGEVHLY